MTKTTAGGSRARLDASAAKRLAPLGLLVAVAVAMGIDRVGGEQSAQFEALPEVLRTAAASVLLFGLAGYAPARLLLPEPLRPHLPLLVLPIGAAAASLVLTFLGPFGVPLPVSLALVLVTGGVAALALRLRRGPVELDRDEGGGRMLRLVWPVLVAVTFTLLLVSPLFRAESFATVLGQNGDAHMATGAAELLQHHPPGDVQPEEPIDRMPPVWKSKYPILYALAGVSSLAGVDPVQSFATLIAVLGGLVAVGFFLLAFHLLQAGPVASLVAMGLVVLDRHLFRIGVEPFYNQLWGLLALPYVLVFSWWYLREPSRGSLALVLLFGAIAGTAYPLLFPYVVLFGAAAAWLEWRRRRAMGERPSWIAALRLPRSRRSLLAWVPAGLIVVPLSLVLAGNAADKMWDALKATLPGGDLGPWTGSAIGFFPIGTFVGVPDGAGFLVLVAALAALAVVGLAGAERERAIPLAVIGGALLLAALWFRVRGEGALFHFRALGFLGPLVLAAAGVGLARVVVGGRTWMRATGVVAGFVIVAVLGLNVRDRLKETFPHVTPALWELREWNDRIPPGASILIDVKPYGREQWAGYMLSEHPLSARDPLLKFFPHPPKGRRADYLLTVRQRRIPRDAAGAPVLANEEFALYRMRRGLPGADRSSRALVEPQLEQDSGAE